MAFRYKRLQRITNYHEWFALFYQRKRLCVTSKAIYGRGKETAARNFASAGS